MNIDKQHGHGHGYGILGFNYEEVRTYVHIITMHNFLEN